MGNIITTLTPVQKRSMMAAAALIIVLTVLAVVWVVKANYQAIPVDNVQQSAALIEKFEQNNLDYKYTSSGELLVNQEQLGKSQLLLEQAQGSNFLSHGLELFDKTDYGMTEHAQKVTFQRAMQGELERTLSSLSYINYARVHLTLADKKLFSSDSLPAKASVTLFAEPGYEMTRRNVTGVQSLVAAAIEGLNTEQVTVFSQHGKQLSSGSADSDEQALLVGSAAKEAQLIQKVEKLLALYMMPSQFAVSASVELSHKKMSSVEKSLLVGPSGEGVIIRKKTSNRGLTNNDEQSEPNSLQVNEELEYSVGSKTEQSTQLAGHVERVSIAVALTANVGEQQIAKLKTLLASATGLNKARGDTVAIEYFEPIILTNTPPAEVANSKPELVTQPHTKLQTSAVATNQWALNFTSFQMALLILMPASILLLGAVLIRRRRLPKKERQALLQEVSQWLEAQEASNAR
ncbi:Flagellar M-ring protein [Pseudoalteromonas holothuriae]|uniref:Flagellar M-ring protein n=1 Tax=Pseudoalteromonas holothuriae TaxID=2963714 RepID=A0ABN8UHH0_9GAMM|nr:flagellar M-ring protein FliF C-terminal domain-containing protein [Pseudoalteromonas sp. CIP111951]CAH9051041.1 Flagellar M-ring protein [Pseudoalteromonas sp. CIP111951]